jgi:hypothetical protein
MQADRVLTEHNRFRAALNRPEQVQQDLLTEILAANADTAFGREHGLPGVRTADEFRRAVPIRTHEDLSPWIKRAMAGETRVLTGEDPVMYFSSSGSTGREKHIPVTPCYMRRCFLPFYHASFAVLLNAVPQALSAADGVLNLWQDPGSPRAQTRHGQPHIGPSQIDYRQFGEASSAVPGATASWARIPPELAGVDPWERAYLKLRLAAQQDIRVLIAINPALVAGLPYQLARMWPRLAGEIRDGTLGGLPHAAPDPRRAEEIAGFAEQSGTVHPYQLWPNLSAILVWNSALASLYLPRLRPEYGPGAAFFAAPIASSEGPAAVPIDRGTGAPLYVPGCFYEFVPAERELTGDAGTLLATEVVPGRDYHLIMSHVGGLFRCAVTDVVRVVGYAGRTPRIEYAGRNVERTAAGARLTEPGVVRALAAAIGDTGAELRNATVELTGGRCRIAVAGEVPDGFAAALDHRLGRTCAGYRAARDSGALAEVEIIRVHPDAFLHEWESAIRAGQRPTRVKDRVFLPASDTWARIVADRPIPDRPITDGEGPA